MPYTNTKKIFEDAIKNSYAVGAFNVSNLEFIQAVIDAAEENKSPVIIQASESACKYAGFDNLVLLVKNMAKNKSASVALHLDHGSSFEVCKKAIDAGFSSVMIDASALGFEENVLLTKKVVDYAHKKNVSVEAELGEIVGVEDEKFSDKEHFTNPLQAREFVKRTGVDSLAISIGTAHGINKSKEIPNIRFDIISKIEKQLPSFPLVCHGASSVKIDFVKDIERYGGRIKKAQGIPEEQLRKMAKTNIVKINMDTDLRLCFSAAIRKYLAENPECFDPRKYLGFGRDEVKKYLIYVMDKILHSKNQIK